MCVTPQQLFRKQEFAKPIAKHTHVATAHAKLYCYNLTFVVRPPLSIMIFLEILLNN